MSKCQKIQGIEESSRRMSFVGYVKDINPAFVTIEKWNQGGEEERYNSSSMFLIELTEEEFEEKYKEKAIEVFKNIQNKLHKDEIGYHEMWNGWLYGSFYEIAKTCIDNNMIVVGHCSDITPKHSLIDNHTLDVGICAKTENGERFWCHFSSENLKRIISRFEKRLK